MPSNSEIARDFVVRKLSIKGYRLSWIKCRSPHFLVDAPRGRRFHLYVKPGRGGQFRWQSAHDGLVSTLRNEGYVALVALDEQDKPDKFRIVSNADLQRQLKADFDFYVDARPDRRDRRGTNRQINFGGQDRSDNRGYNYAKKLGADWEAVLNG